MQDYPVKVGSMLLTMVDPHKGHEVAYNRWYERDHFYAGCMVGPWLFAGRRWVSPRVLKNLRFPEQSPLVQPSVRAGSYVATYWIHADKHAEHHAWANPQAHWLYQQGRGFNERTHVHTLMYTHDWNAYRDADPVPIELALDHAYPGMVTFAVQRAPGVDKARVEAWFRDNLPDFWRGTSIASCATFSAIPQNTKAPMNIPIVEDADRLQMQMYFLDAIPAQNWTHFERLGALVDQSGIARVLFASPWLPTIIGTDTYTDQLW